MARPVAIAFVTDADFLGPAWERVLEARDVTGQMATSLDVAVSLVGRGEVDVALVDAECAFAPAFLRAIRGEAGAGIAVETLHTRAAREAHRDQRELAGRWFSPEAPWEDAALGERLRALGLRARRRRAADVEAEPEGVTLPLRSDLLLPPPAPLLPPRLVVIAASTGGPAALMRLLPALGAALPVPVAVVQHILAGSVEGLVERLDQLCAAKVAVAASAQRLEPGRIYFAPGEQHLMVDKWGSSEHLRFSLANTPPRHGVRPAADVLFESAARACGSRVVGVVLTGLGCDGTAGALAIRAEGGRVIAESRHTAVASAMPLSVVRAGASTRIEGLDGIARRIVAWTTESLSIAGA